jgi:hypothetical protein
MKSLVTHRTNREGPVEIIVIENRAGTGNPLHSSPGDADAHHGAFSPVVPSKTVNEALTAAPRPPNHW